MAASGENLPIGAFADIAGVSVETIRFYQRKGLIRLPEKPFGGIRRYDAADVARVRFVKSAQRLGFSLDEVRGLLRLEDGTQCGEARQLAEQKLTEVRSKIADLVHIESVLDELVAECQTSTVTVRCPLIDSLHGGGQSG